MRTTSFEHCALALCFAWAAIAQPVCAEIPNGTVLAWGAPSSPAVTNVPIDLTNVIALAAGSAHSLALRADGTVVAWGNNADGQTNVPPDLSNVTSIAAGANHSLALKADGTVVAWGRNADGQTNVPPDARGIAAIAGGNRASLALRKDGTLMLWGKIDTYPLLVKNALGVAAGLEPSASFGETVLLKDGTVVQRQFPPIQLAPLFPLSLTNVIALAGRDPLLALRHDGTVVSWSLNAFGTTPANVTNVVGLARGSTCAIALRGDGSVITWNFTNPKVPAGLTNVTAVAAGDNHCLALVNPWPAFVLQPLSQVISLGGMAVFHTTAVGRAPLRFQWQFNGVDIPLATNGSLRLTNAPATAMGAYQCVVTDAGGAASSHVATLTVVPVCAWGTSGEANSSWWNWLPEELTNAVALAVGYNHNLALKSDGTVFAWGRPNATGECTVPVDLTNAVAIAAGGSHSLAVRSDGTVVGWGDNTYGQISNPPGLTNVVALAAGLNHSLALTREGRLVAWGDNRNAQIPDGPPDFTSFQISAGPNSSIAVNSNGLVQTWGWIGGRVMSLNWKSIVQASAAYNDCFGLRADGVVVTNSSYGSPVGGLSNVVSIAVCGDSLPFQDTCLALKKDGTVAFLGGRSGSPTNFPAELRNVFALAAAGLHALAMLGDGSPRLIRQTGASTPPLFGAVALSATVSGAQPLYYQWRHNHQEILGATNAALALSNLQASANGDYSVLVTNAFGSLVVSNMAITVVPVAFWDSWIRMPITNEIPPDAQAVLGIAAGSSLNLLLMQDSTVRSVGWGFEPPPGLSNVVGLANGWLQSLALKADGTVVAWGDPHSPTYVPEGLTNIVAVSAGDDFNLALTEAGSVISWGASTNVPHEATNVVAIAGGCDHMVALRQDGTVIAWDKAGVLHANIPAGLNQVVAIAAGFQFSMALKRDGSLVAWGSPYPPGSVSNVVAISACSSYALALRSDGTLMSWNADNPFPLASRSYSNAVAISAGGYTMVLVSEDPTAWAPRIINPYLTGESITFSVPTRSGKVYLLEYKDYLDTPDWTPMPMVAGNGRLRTFTAPAPVGIPRFYRVRHY